MVWMLPLGLGSLSPEMLQFSLPVLLAFPHVPSRVGRWCDWARFLTESWDAVVLVLLHQASQRHWAILLTPVEERSRN